MLSQLLGREGMEEAGMEGGGRGGGGGTPIRASRTSVSINANGGVGMEASGAGACTSCTGDATTGPCATLKWVLSAATWATVGAAARQVMAS